MEEQLRTEIVKLQQLIQQDNELQGTINAMVISYKKIKEDTNMTEDLLLFGILTSLLSNLIYNKKIMIIK